MTTSTAAPSFAATHAALEGRINVELAQLTLDWKWYVLTPHGIELGKRRESPMDPELLAGKRFLADGKAFGPSKVREGEFADADLATPIAANQEFMVPRFCSDRDVAIIALDRCAYVNLHKAAGWYRITCSRTERMADGTGKAEGKSFALVASTAVARAYGVRDL